MNNEVLQRLILVLDTKRYVSVLRRCLNKNNKIRIPGFANITNAPRNSFFQIVKKENNRSLFLASVFEEFVKPEEIREDLERETVETVRESITAENKPGVIAYCIQNGSESYLSLANELLVELEQQKSNDVYTETSKSSNAKTDKKEESFRTKYLALNKNYKALSKQLDGFSKLNEEQQQQIDCLSLKFEEEKKQKEVLESTIDSLNNRIVELQNKNLGFAGIINEKDGLISELNKQIEELKQQYSSVEKDLNQLRPKKHYYLAGYIGNVNLSVNNGDINDCSFEDEYDLEKHLAECDELWIVMDSLSFMKRKIVKGFRGINKEKIRTFKTIDELHSYIGTL